MASVQQTEDIKLNGSGAGSQLVLDHPWSYSVKGGSTAIALSAVAGFTDAAVTGGTANAMAKVVLTQSHPAEQQPRMTFQGSLDRGYFVGQSV